MSVVTNVLILSDFAPKETNEALYEGYEDAEGRPVYFRDIADYRGGDGPADEWGGTKLPEVEVWAGAFNHLDTEVMLTWLRSLKWLDPTIVAIKHEYTDTWYTVTLEAS